MEVTYESRTANDPMKKLVVIQHIALFIISVTMKSTFVVTLPSQTDEITLKKKTILAINFTLNILSMSSCPLRELIFKPSIL